MRILILVAMLILFQSTYIHSALIPEDKHYKGVKEVLEYLGRDLKFVNPIYISAKVYNINPVLWGVLIETESGYNIRAKSNKGYKGLAQTQKAYMKSGYETHDLLEGARILREKLDTSYSNGNYLKAIQLYKGGKNKIALKQARHVLAKYYEIKTALKIT